MTGQAPTRVRQTPTRIRLIRVFHRNYIRRGYLYSGCVPYEHLRTRFGTGVQLLIDDLIRDGILQRRNCGALAYELVPAARQSLREKHGLGGYWEDQKPIFHLDHCGLADLGPSPTSAERSAARLGMSVEVYQLQNRLRELPITPGTNELRSERDRVTKALIHAARRDRCIPRINLMAGTIAE